MGSTHNAPQSWGRFPKVNPSQVLPIYWRSEVPDLEHLQESVLPYGYGRSYGDSGLNENGIALDITPLKRFMAFDEEQGLLRCESGVSLEEILKVMVPQGWFLPVSPGTKFVSVGGAIANDVHGKNHHKAGTFGCHVTQLELLRSDGTRLICSPTQNSELFNATIGGLGLTGLILWAEFYLRSIKNPFIDVDHIRFSSLDEFMEIEAESEHNFEYTMSWIDCLSSGSNLGRGVFMRGNHNQSRAYTLKKMRKPLPLAVPFDLPGFTLNKLSNKAFNLVLYYKQQPRRTHKVTSYEPFFYPLDAIHNWNRMYGRRGFFQYQCVVPYELGSEVMKEMLRRISRAGEGTFVAVLKKFGDILSPGMLSFPRPGLTLALDFSNKGQKTLSLFDELDVLVRESGGAIYPAKDARMHGADFKTYFPRWSEFEQYIDPHFSSSFWRRVMATEPVPVPGQEIMMVSN